MGQRSKHTLVLTLSSVTILIASDMLFYLVFILSIHQCLHFQFFQVFVKIESQSMAPFEIYPTKVHIDMILWMFMGLCVFVVLVLVLRCGCASIFSMKCQLPLKS